MQTGAYYTFRSTTDKLAEHMNHIVQSGDVVIAPTFTGGRDWIIVCSKGKATTTERIDAAVDAFAANARRSA